MAILFKMKDYKDAVAVLLPLGPGVINAEGRTTLLFKAYTLLGDTAIVEN